jgi:hypothetical protein
MPDIVLRAARWTFAASDGLTHCARRNTLSIDATTEPPRHYLNAAIGWLGPGRRDDAEAELELISPKNQRHPDVLEARWAIYAEER